MRVLVIANNFPWPDHLFDGVFNLRALQALRERGIELRVVRCVPWAPPVQKRWQRYRTVPDRYVVDGIPVRTLRGLMGPASWGIGTLRQQLRARFGEEVERFAPDVVHVHGLLPSGVLALDVSTPVVLTSHGSETYALPWQRKGLERLARAIVARANAAVGVSRFVAEHLERLGAREVSVVPNGADERLFFPRERKQARRLLGMDLEVPIVLFVGHATEEKGGRELVHALRSMADIKPLALFAGKGDLLPWIERELSGAGIAHRFLGSLAHEELASLYAAADVVTLPSYREGLPTVLCEAMNSGRAVVATAVGGIPEIVEDGVTGYVVPPRDSDALAARLRAVIADETTKAQMERAAHAFARTALTWSVNASRYDDIYRRVTSRQPVYGNTI